MRRLFSCAFLLALCGPLTASAASPASAAAGLNPNLFAGLHWRLIGPFRGGRALAVTGVPGRPNTFYFGAVGGGVWKTGNAGRTWRPVFDREPVASIGAIAVAPSSPSVVYVGSGEADMRSDIQAGDGMYRSINAGKTWERIGLRETRQIGAIVVDPQDAKTLYVAALGNQYAPNAERGVFKSTNGGKTWTKVLYENADTGAVDLSMDPSDPNVLFAALWQTRRPPWNVYPPSSGPGSGLYKTTDGGKTWARVAGHGFPAKAGRIGIAISPADTRRVYAVVDTNDPATGGIYRSDDGGTTWKRTDGENRVWKRGWYFGGITADPKNPNEVYVMDTSTYRSTDGGVTFVAIKGAPGGDDYHTLWIDPSQPSHMILGGDQGVVISLDDAKTWSSWYNQPTGQFYHIATDNRFPFWVYGSQQDSGAAMVPSR
ncbi:MAG: WD40/YVTN/BNR-like repeat-containing protein, partial [Vulcanimicrobiaceae bacterium]